jgi:hypothetical protein
MFWRSQCKPCALKNLSKHNNWLTVRLVGTMSNRDAVDTVVRVHLPERIILKEVRAGLFFLSRNSPFEGQSLTSNK